MLDVVQEVFIADATILSYLQLSNASAIERAQGIIKRSFYTGLAGGKSRLCIFLTPTRRNNNQFIKEDVLEINCHVPVSRDMFALDVLQRAFLLLHERTLANHILYLDGTLGELPTAENYYCAGSRFYFYSTTKNS